MTHTDTVTEEIVTSPTKTKGNKLPGRSRKPGRATETKVRRKGREVLLRLELNDPLKVRQPSLRNREIYDQVRLFDRTYRDVAQEFTLSASRIHAIVRQCAKWLRHTGGQEEQTDGPERKGEAEYLHRRRLNLLFGRAVKEFDASAVPQTLTKEVRLDGKPTRFEVTTKSPSWQWRLLELALKAEESRMQFEWSVESTLPASSGHSVSSSERIASLRNNFDEMLSHTSADQRQTWQQQVDELPEAGPLVLEGDKLIADSQTTPSQSRYAVFPENSPSRHRYDPTHPDFTDFPEHDPREARSMQQDEQVALPAERQAEALVPSSAEEVSVSAEQPQPLGPIIRYNYGPEQRDRQWHAANYPRTEHVSHSSERADQQNRVVITVNPILVDGIPAMPPKLLRGWQEREKFAAEVRKQRARAAAFLRGEELPEA